jgi:hypothetical protein
MVFPPFRLTSLRNGRVWMPSLALLAAVVAAGCEGLNDRGSLPLSTVQPAPTEPTTAVDRSDAGTPAIQPSPTDAGGPAPTNPVLGSYAAMCRNYCGALEQTQVYACIGRAQGDATTCAERFTGTETQCWDLRCAPGLIQQSTCYAQCDSLATSYADACTANPDLFVCATPPAAHDAACRAGCVLDPSVP